jgi:pyruvate dehydrogenase E1 component alpha subunit
MPHAALDGNDLDEVVRVVGQAADRARKGEGPSYLVADTYRFRGHSMSDAMKYRSKEELERARLRDPLVIYERRLMQKGLLDHAQVEAMELELRKVMDEAVKFAEASPHPEASELYTDIYSETYPFQK